LGRGSSSSPSACWRSPERTGSAPWARHWPLLFLGLAVFLFLRSDPEVWPLGDIGFFTSLRDPEWCSTASSSCSSRRSGCSSGAYAPATCGEQARRWSSR